MENKNKRKEKPSGNSENRPVKKSKGGSGGKWQTPHQKLKMAARGHGPVEPGDIGIWVTCARNQESRAAEEVLGMFEECAERFYGIATGGNSDDGDDGEGSVDDIERSIQKEISNQESMPKLFKASHIDIPCVLFFKTRAPIEPVDFVHRICLEIQSNPEIRRMRYINRLTPMTVIGKATEKGLEEIASSALSKHFKMKETTDGEASGHKDAGTDESVTEHASYAIRPTIRAHNTLTRDIIIKQIASSISDQHKVNLTTPDKVILVEIYTTVCGISVVGSDWEALKRFNLAELYKPPPKNAAAVRAEASPGSVTKDETPKVAAGST